MGDVDRIASLVHRGVSAVLFAALLISGAFVLGVQPVLGTVLMSISILPLLHALFAGLFRRRGPR